MKLSRLLFIFAIGSLLLLSACTGAATPTEAAPAAPQQPTAGQSAPITQAPAVQQAAVPSQAETAQSQYAPFCEAASSTGCTVPSVKMIDNKYCVEKVPYAIMAVPAGTTYESQDADLECVDQVSSDGSLRVTCHSLSSKELWSYDLKLCNSACAVPPLQTGTGQCPEGYGYNAASQCCAAPSPANSDGCTVYRVDIGACPEPQ